MNFTVNKLDDSKVEIVFEIPAKEFDKSVNIAVGRVAQQVNIPGFRKGKAPRNVLEKRVGKDAILHEAYEVAAVPAFRQAIIDEKLDIVSRPEFELISMGENQSLNFKATFIVKPEVQLGEYKALKVETESKEITDEAVDNYLNNIRGRSATMTVCAEDHEIANGDTAVIDFEGFVEGVAFPGGEGKSYPLEIGSNSFIPGFEEQLIGKKAGEVIDVEATFPAEYHAADLAGKSAVFKVTIHELKHKELPELDDEFAKEVSDFETLAEYRADVRRMLADNASQAAERECDRKVIESALANAAVVIPQEMVEQRAEQMMHDFSERFTRQGISMEQYLQYTGMTIEALRSQHQDSARNETKYELVMEAIAKAEQLAVSDEEMGEELERIGAQHNMTADKVAALLRKNDRFDEVRQSLLWKKARELVIATSKA